MPEGDTILRAARTLHQALAGKTVTRFETVLPRLARVDDQQPIAGRRRGFTAEAGNRAAKCGTKIESKRQGVDAWLTFWCPKCQM
jgi:formamidopyrimidine-DNA glycosylase